MAAVECPKCGKSLKVNDSLAGKRVRCPGCKNPFVVPDAPVVELVEDEEEQEERVTKRPRRDAARRPRDEEEDDDKPRRPRRSRDEEEDDDEPRRPRRRRPRDDNRDSASFSSAPLVYGILACLLSCAPIIGFLLGSLAMSKANAELDRLPGGKRGRAGRKQMQLAKTLGVVGMCLSFVFLIVGIVLKVTDKL
ncbi:MAG TPA: MJ0042-type zinc finger domain-containing protein [Gemmataceae bacterium]|nr:MJ0042-type zinc finger domain-containing protein [Gemmataceae bacterium]